VALVALVVVGLALLGDAARTARVPDAVGTVQVHSGESLWAVARRVAPSADPGAVAARIADLNHLASPSVQPGEVLLSPIG
jgi:LysM repeat protein